MNQESQAELTSAHLRRGMGIEVWLIPYSVFTSLVILLITVMVSLKTIRNRTKSKKKRQVSRSNREELYMTTESNDRLNDEFDLTLSKCNGQLTNSNNLENKVTNSTYSHNNTVVGSKYVANGGSRTSRTSSTSSYIKMKPATEVAQSPEHIPAIPPPAYNQIHNKHRERKQPEWLHSFDDKMPTSNL